MMEAAATRAPSTSTATAADPPPKQGYRFHKSGSSSPIPPPQVQRRPHQNQAPSNSHPISESSSSAPAATANDTTLASGSRVQNSAAAASSSSTEAPAGVDPKLYQIVKRITSSTPSLLISSSAGESSFFVQFQFHWIYRVSISVGILYMLSDLEEFNCGYFGGYSYLSTVLCKKFY